MPRLLALAAALLLSTPAGAQALLAAGPVPASMPAVAATADAGRRAERLVVGWQLGDVASTLDAFAAEFRTPAGVTVPRVVQILTRRLGAVTSVAAESTTVRPDGHVETVVAVGFARGAERLRFVWNADGGLRTVARAARPAALVAAAVCG